MSKSSKAKRERRRRNKAEGRPFRIVVCSYPSRTFDSVEQLMKAAVLYGDQVTLHSPMAALIGSVAALADAPTKEFVAQLLDLGALLPSEVQEQFQQFQTDDNVRILRTLLDPHTPVRSLLSAGQRGELDSFVEQIEGSRADINRVVDEQLTQAGYRGIAPAFDAGFVSIEPIDISVDFSEGYLASLQRLLLDPTMYPIFDGEVRKLLRTFVDAGEITVGTHQASRNTQATTAERFLSRLPTFPLATMDEIVDIRDDLRRPLTAFRSEMVKLSVVLRSTPLEADFDEAAQNAWVEHVEPALDELGELTRERNLLRTYGFELATGAAGASAGLVVGLAIHQPLDAAMLTSTVSAAAAASTAIVRGSIGRERKAAALNAHPYYFLHQTEARLS
jgi:hypothetical protein